MEETRIKAYLERIGAAAFAERSEENLDHLIVCHLNTVPFENIDVIDFGQVPDLDEEKLYEKIVTRRRGGYCFELNRLFGRLLEGLGYSVYPVAVRVVWNRDWIPALSHMALIVELDHTKYFCDVGFGGPGPKGLLRLCAAQQINGETYRVETAEDGDYLIEWLHKGKWEQVLRFEDRAVREVDFQLLNFYCAKNKAVLFARSRVVNLCTPKGSKALNDLELVVREEGQERRVLYKDKKELEAGLAEEFGIRVSLMDERHR